MANLCSALVCECVCMCLGVLSFYENRISFVSQIVVYKNVIILFSNKNEKAKLLSIY